MSDLRITTIFLVVLVLLFTIYYGSFYFVTRGHTYLDSKLEVLEPQIKNGDWREAKATFNELERRWKRVRYYLMLNYAEGDFSNFIMAMGRLRAAVEIEDKPNALSEAKSLYTLWHNMLRIVPQP